MLIGARPGRCVMADTNTNPPLPQDAPHRVMCATFGHTTLTAHTTTCIYCGAQVPDDATFDRPIDFWPVFE